MPVTKLGHSMSPKVFPFPLMTRAYTGSNGPDSGKVAENKQQNYVNIHQNYMSLL